MPAIGARFAVLALFYCLSTHWLSSIPTAHAAVISRGAQSSGSPFDDDASHSQHVFPWSRVKPGISQNQDHSRRRLSENTQRRHKVRSEGFFASNPFHRLADAFTSLLKGHHKRSHKTITIPNDHGSLYVLSHSRRADTPQWVSRPNSTAAQGQPGYVDIQSSPNDSTQPGVRIASLVLQVVDGTYILNASQNNRTRLYLVNAQDPTTRGSEAGGGDDIQVFMEIPQLANFQDYCATYDPNPNGTEPMTMQPCFENNVSNNAYNASNPHASQTFLYNERSGQIRPTWFSGEDDGTDGNNTTTTAQGAYPQRPGSPQGPQGQRPGFGSRNTNAQNVTLIFVPAGNFGAADISESTSASASLATATLTTTVTVYASATGSSAFSSSSASSSSTSTSSGTSPSASGMGVEAVGGIPVLGSMIPSLPVSAPVSPPTPGVANGTTSASVSGSAASTSTSSSSIGAAAITVSPDAVSSSSVASASASTSTSINATAIAASIAASADASYSSWSSAYAASSTGAAASASPSSTFMAAVLSRRRMPRKRAAKPDKTPVSTDPYSWNFKAEPM